MRYYGSVEEKRDRADAPDGRPVKLNSVQQHILNELEWRKTHDYLKDIPEEVRRETNREWNVSEHHASSHGGLMGRVSMRQHDSETPWDEPVEFDPRAVKLATQAIEESRTSLMMAFRYLDRALWKLPLQTAGIAAPLATDGITLYFNPLLVIARYRQSRHELARDLLHTVLHCVFRHPFPAKRDFVLDWKTTCDFVVESVALELCAGRFACAGDARRAQIIESVSARMGGIVPARLYRALQRAYDARYIGGADSLSKEEAHEIEALFARDDPAPWDLENEVVTMDYDTERPEGAPAQEPHDDDAHDLSGGGKDEDAGGGQTDARDEGPAEDGQATGPEADEGREAQPSVGDQQPDDPSPSPTEKADQQDSGSFGAGAQDEDASDRARDEWSEIARRIEVDMRTMSHTQGTSAGAFVTNLTLANRRRIDYADFLRQFSTMAEDLRINPDEFDYIYYAYGLELFGNRPLVEPLEYVDHHRVRDFVIALDTSGSCSGELVRSFATRTFEILKQGELFGGSVNVHIVQCDAKVQSDTVIDSLADLEGYIDDFEVLGLGGTDFRPVFDYVGELIARGEFNDLRGLIYFTDGLGIYPDAPPPYDTAFVFIEEEGQPRLVPPWAMKVILDEDQVREL